MFELMGPGTLIGPWMGMWELAWQSPTTGFAVLACLPTLLLTGFFLMTRDAGRHRSASFGPGVETAQPGSAGRPDGRRHNDRQQGGRHQAAA